MQKTTLQAGYSCSMQKTGSKKQLIFEKWDDYENWQKWPLCKGYNHNGQFETNIKTAKNMQKSGLKAH